MENVMIGASINDIIEAYRYETAKVLKKTGRL